MLQAHANKHTSRGTSSVPFCYGNIQKLAYAQMLRPIRKAIHASSNLYTKENKPYPKRVFSLLAISRAENKFPHPWIHTKYFLNATGAPSSSSYNPFAPMYIFFPGTSLTISERRTHLNARSICIDLTRFSREERSRGLWRRETMTLASARYVNAHVCLFICLFV